MAFGGARWTGYSGDAQAGAIGVTASGAQTGRSWGVQALCIAISLNRYLALVYFALDERPSTNSGSSFRVRRYGGAFAPARNSLQLHIVFGPRNSHSPAGRRGMAIARCLAQRAPDRARGPYAVRSVGRYLGRAAQPVSAGRHAGQSEASPGIDRCAEPSTGRFRLSLLVFGLGCCWCFGRHVAKRL